jgi:hypothetical protein
MGCSMDDHSCFDFVQHFRQSKRNVMEEAAPETAATPQTCIGIHALKVNPMPTSSSAVNFNFGMASLSPLFLFYYGSHPPDCTHFVSAHIHSATTRGKTACCIGWTIMEGKAAPNQASADMPFFSTSLSADKPPQSSPLVMIPEIPASCEISAGFCLLFKASKSS